MKQELAVGSIYIHIYIYIYMKVTILIRVIFHSYVACLIEEN